jgi:hypothetical protein
LMVWELRVESSRITDYWRRRTEDGGRRTVDGLLTTDYGTSLNAEKLKR